MAAGDQPGRGWTVVLRRQPARIVEGEADGGYTDLFEIICCDCGDDPDLEYRDVSPWLQLIRGPYPLRDGVAAYNQHLGQHHKPAPTRTASQPRPDSPRDDPAGDQQVIGIGPTDGRSRGRVATPGRGDDR
jgi:hypothetical protein